MILTLFKRYTGPFLPPNSVYQYLVKHMCHSPIKIVCSNVLFLACGFSESKQLNMSRIGVYSYGAPAGTSAKNIAHFGQSVNSRKFQFYDYGTKGLFADFMNIVTVILFYVSNFRQSCQVQSKGTSSL